MYQLDKTKANISPYKDEVREYNLINVFMVELSEETKTNKIAAFIMNAIPYPNVIVFSYKGKMQLAVAHQRINQNDSEKNVLEPLTISRWFDYEENLFDISKMNMNNCYTLYCDIADFISIDTAKDYTTATQLTGEQARQIKAKIEEIDTKIAILKSKINKETQFNNRVEMNMQIRKLKKEREKYAQ